MVLSPTLEPTELLLHRLAVAGAEAATLREYRERVLALLAESVAFDSAAFHAFSPRVPLDTGAYVGVDVERVAALVPNWDRLAVELGALREVALARGGVVTDTEAFPAGSKGRARFDDEVARKLGVRALLMAHLVVRGAIRSGVMLFKQRGAFTAADADLIRKVTPSLAVADAMHAALDAAPRASMPVRMQCLDQRLTARQREIVEHVALGHTNDAIAQALGLSTNTLRNHLAEVFRRLGAANRADVVRLSVLRPLNG